MIFTSSLISLPHKSLIPTRQTMPFASAHDAASARNALSHYCILAPHLSSINSTISLSGSPFPIRVMYILLRAPSPGTTQGLCLNSTTNTTVTGNHHKGLEYGVIDWMTIPWMLRTSSQTTVHTIYNYF